MAAIIKGEVKQLYKDKAYKELLLSPMQGDINKHNQLKKLAENSARIRSNTTPVCCVIGMAQQTLELS